MSLFRVSKSLDHLGGKDGHGGIAAAFGDGKCLGQLRFRPGVGVIQCLILQKFGEILCAGNDLHHRLLRTEEEPGSVHGILVKEGEALVHELFEALVGLYIRLQIDGDEYMELGARSLSVLGLHVITAVMDGDEHIRQDLCEVLGRDPVGGILGVCVVAFQRETVGLDEVLIAPAAILVLGADIIPADSLLQRGGSGDADGLGIHIVVGLPKQSAWYRVKQWVRGMGYLRELIVEWYSAAVAVAGGGRGSLGVALIWKRG